MTYKPSIGTISHATLRSEDLVDAFVTELKCFDDLSEDEKSLIDEAEDWQAVDVDRPWIDADLYQECGYEITNELQDVLDTRAPSYCYFGTISFDGSDFGFWPCRESIDELPRVKDPSEIPDGGTGADTAFVNDHGNVTIYAADGSIILEIV